MHKILKRLALVTVFALTILLFRTSASAYTFTFVGKGVNSQTGSVLAAQAQFDYDGGTQLLITLSNISGTGALAPSDVLAAVFFNMDEKDTATPLFAKLGANSKLLNPPGNYSLGKEWDFEQKKGILKSANTGIGEYWDRRILG